MKEEHSIAELLKRIEELERKVYEDKEQLKNRGADVPSSSDKTISSPWEREGYETKERWLNEKRK